MKIRDLFDRPVPGNTKRDESVKPREQGPAIVASTPGVSRPKPLRVQQGVSAVRPAALHSRTSG
jgi:hypothetical protein